MAMNNPHAVIDAWERGGKLPHSKWCILYRRGYLECGGLPPLWVAGAFSCKHIAMNNPHAVIDAWERGGKPPLTKAGASSRTPNGASCTIEDIWSAAACRRFGLQELAPANTWP